MDLSQQDFKRVEKIGSADFFISDDGQYFKKVFDDNSDLMRQEYRNLKDIRTTDPVDGLQFIQPIKVTDTSMITRHVDAEHLLGNPCPEHYEQFGEKLRHLHEEGYTHSHLQFNDVLYDGNSFYLTDMCFMNERDRIYDLVIPKVGLDVFKLKRPWRWRSYNLCYRKFLDGYGEKRFAQSRFDRVYHDFLDAKIDSYRSGNGRDWKYRMLRLAKPLIVRY